jgi:hypothetical protein
MKSQAGYELRARAKGGGRLRVLEFSTGTLKRVCRSTLAAESNGLVAAVEAADYLRSAILAANRPIASLSELLDRGDLIPAQAYTDAKSFYDGASKDASRLQEEITCCGCSAS